MSEIVAQENTFFSPVCNKCKHYMGGGKCPAFTGLIPDEILIDGNKHSKPLPEQDNDIVFEKDERDNVI